MTAAAQKFNRRQHRHGNAKMALPIRTWHRRLHDCFFGFATWTERRQARAEFVRWCQRHGYDASWTDYQDTHAPFAAQVILWSERNGFCLTFSGGGVRQTLQRSRKRTPKARTTYVYGESQLDEPVTLDRPMHA